VVLQTPTQRGGLHRPLELSPPGTTTTIRGVGAISGNL
jgi:hypothetical protein